MWMKRRTTIWLDEVDRAAIQIICERYGTATESDAVWLALRLVAECKRVNLEEQKRER